MQCCLLRFVGLQSSFLRGHSNGSGHGRHHRRDHERRPTGSLLFLPGEHYLGQPALSLQRWVKHSEELKGWTAATKRFSFIQQFSSAKERTSAICSLVSRKYWAKFHKAIKYKPFQFYWLYLEHFPKYEKYWFYLAEDSLSKSPASFWSQSCLMLANLVIWCVFVNQLCTDWKYAIISRAMNAATNVWFFKLNCELAFHCVSSDTLPEDFDAYRAQQVQLVAWWQQTGPNRTLSNAQLDLRRKIITAIKV